MKKLIPILCLFAVGCGGYVWEPNPPGMGSGTTRGPGTEQKPFTPRGPFPVTGLHKRGQLAIACNCNYTSAYDGEIVETMICDTGYHQFQACPLRCASGFPAWKTVCSYESE